MAKILTAENASESQNRKPPRAQSMQREKDNRILSDLCGSKLSLDRRRFLLRPVDLCSLQPVRVIDINRLPLSVEIDCSNSALAVAITCGLDSTKGQMHLGANGRRVDVSDAGVQ